MDGHHIRAAVGVDQTGDKHVLGLTLGASENAHVVKYLLRQMFGQHAQVQRCRSRKLRNVLELLPKTEAAQTKAVMMTACKLDAKEGIAKMKKQAQCLERE